MPNHVTNHIRIGLTGCTATQFLEKIRGEQDVIDFEKIIPPPDDYYRGDLTTEDRQREPNNWYDWNVRYWGTKWNAYSQSLDEQWDSSDGESGEVEISFDTAWAPPLPVIEALREWPEVEYICGNWVEEFCESAGVF